jgi:hypothetical protein
MRCPAGPKMSLTNCIGRYPYGTGIETTDAFPIIDMSENCDPTMFV